jgi:hypothetical protein
MPNAFQRFTMPIKNVASENELAIIILGADVSPRKKSQGAKSLIPLSPKWNVIEMQLDAIKTMYPKAEVILITGFQSQQVINKKYPLKIIENPFYDETSDVEQIRIALNATLSSKVLIVNGDLAFDAPSLMNIEKHGSNVLFTDEKTLDKDDTCIGVVHNNNVVENLVYCTPNKWLHTLYAEGKELDILRKFIRNKERSKLLLFEAINYIISSGGLIRAVPQRFGTMYRIGT